MADETQSVDPEQEEPRSKRSSSGGSRTWLWMILAFVVVGGFLAWLSVASEPTQVAIVDGGDGDDDESAEPGVTVVAKDTLAADKQRFAGQQVRVDRVEGTGSLGAGIFWGELGTRANQVPILVRLDSTAAQGWEFREGAQYNLTGVIRPMTDSLAAVWGEQGEFRGEGEEMQAAFTDYFIQVSRIRASRSRDGG